MRRFEEGLLPPGSNQVGAPSFLISHVLVELLVVSSMRFAPQPFVNMPCQEFALRGHGPYRLVVRTSRRGRDNPGWTPGGGNYGVDARLDETFEKQSGGKEWTRSKQGRADLQSAALTTVRAMSPTCDH